MSTALILVAFASILLAALLTWLTSPRDWSPETHAEIDQAIALTREPRP